MLNDKEIIYKKFLWYMPIFKTVLEFSYNLISHLEKKMLSKPISVLFTLYSQKW